MGIFGNKKETVISKEAAEQELNEFYKSIHDCDDDYNPAKHFTALINGMVRGRVVIDKDTETITINFIKPIVKGNAELKELVVRELNISELQKMSNAGDEIEAAKYIINSLSGNKFGASVSELSSRDMKIIVMAVGLFIADQEDMSKKNALKQ